MIELRQSETFARWRLELRDDRFKAALAKRMVRIQSGLFGDIKTIGNGIGELRFDIGPGYRVYFHRKQDTLIILLCGGNKSSQRRDVAKARQLMRELELIP